MESTFRVYMAEGINAMTRNTSQNGGVALRASYRDVISNKKIKEEIRTPDEVIEHLKRGIDKLRES